jgi:hypothetical protein
MVVLVIALGFLVIGGMARQRSQETATVWVVLAVVTLGAALILFVLSFFQRLTDLPPCFEQENSI